MKQKTKKTGLKSFDYKCRLSLIISTSLFVISLVIGLPLLMNLETKNETLINVIEKTAQDNEDIQSKLDKLSR